MSVIRFEPFGDPFRQIDRLTSQLLSGTRTPIAMPMDVWQAEDGFHVALDLPGVDPSSVEITVERNLLTIRAERRPEFQEEHNVLVAERPQGSFTRQLQLGETLDSEDIHADYSDGVLHLTIPVARAAQPRRITVGQGGAEGSGGQPRVVEGSRQESAAGGPSQSE